MSRPSLPVRANALRGAPPHRATPPPRYNGCAVRPPVAIHREDAWRQPAALAAAAPDSASAVASRWTDLRTHTREQHADTNPPRITRSASPCGRPILRSWSTARSFTTVRSRRAPCMSAALSRGIRGTFRAPCDFLHLHVRNSFLAGCGGESHALAAHLCFLHDPVIEQLGHALLAADAMHGGYCALYAEGIAQAIITRLLDLSRYPKGCGSAEAGRGIADVAPQACSRVYRSPSRQDHYADRSSSVRWADTHAFRRPVPRGPPGFGRMNTCCASESSGRSICWTPRTRHWPKSRSAWAFKRNRISPRCSNASPARRPAGGGSGTARGACDDVRRPRRCLRCHSNEPKPVRWNL